MKNEIISVEKIFFRILLEINFIRYEYTTSWNETMNALCFLRTSISQNSLMITNDYHNFIFRSWAAAQVSRK